MEISGRLITNIGFLFWCIPLFLLFVGRLRNSTILVVLFMISLILSIYGIYIFDTGITFGNNKNAAGFLFAPFIFITLYTLMRYGFIKAYGFEPDFPYHSKYSRIDNRKLNFFDFLVFFIPTVVSVVIVVALSNS